MSGKYRVPDSDDEHQVRHVQFRGEPEPGSAEKGHCWHVVGADGPSERDIQMYRCCFCGKEEWSEGIQIPPSGHGRFGPWSQWMGHGAHWPGTYPVPPAGECPER
jgi:hypothetical protein